MELAKLIRIIQKDIVLILVLGIITALSALIFNKFKPLTYSVFCAISISQAEEDPTKDYKYDNYYSGQAIDDFTDSLEKWFSDASLISASYKNAGIDLGDLSIRQRSKLVKARKLAPQYIEMRFNAKSPDEGFAVTRSLIATLRSRVAELRGDRQVWFTINAQEPLILNDKWDPLVTALASLSGGIILGVIIVLVKFYLKEENKP